MGRHVTLHHPGLLEGVLAAVLASALVLAYLSSRPQTASVGAQGTQAAQAEQESGALRVDASDATTERAGEGGSEATGSLTAPSDAEAWPKPEHTPKPEPEPEPEPDPVQPAALSAGDVLRDAEVKRAGGADAFFWAEELSDEVFARMEGKSFGANCTVPRSDLRYLRVLHVDAEGSTKVGELVVNRRVADEVLDIFRQLYDARYPIRKMHLVDDYDADDERSCADDNTSGFNYRVIGGTTTLSNHAYGLAIDINTFENPYAIPSQGYISPAGSERYLDRSLQEPYMTHRGDLCYQLFIGYGWSWGGDWESPKDYQHFEKPSALWE